MANYKHYGVDVTYQTLGHSFEDDLKKEGISYKQLPIAEDQVFVYDYAGKKRYAYVASSGLMLDEYWEGVFITTEIPEDMDWKKLALDIRHQKEGDDPMSLPTRARVLYDKAYKRAQEMMAEKCDPADFLKSPFPSDPEEKEIRIALLSFNVTWDELCEMDHSDVPELDEKGPTEEEYARNFEE